MINILNYFLLFFIYSFFGWLIEVMFKIVIDKKLINRGFLIGPYCPIYGVAALLMTLLLGGYTKDIAIVFILSILVAGILEYVTSYIMEKVFDARWWDYSHKKFNINGRICLETVVPFGLLGCAVLYITNPFFINILSILPNIVLIIISIILLIAFIVDNIISFKIIVNFKNLSENFASDNTEEITKRVKKELYKAKSKLNKRLVDAFPNLVITFDKAKERFIKEKEELKENINKKVENVKKNVNELKDETVEKLNKEKVKRKNYKK